MHLQSLASIFSGIRRIFVNWYWMDWKKVTEAAAVFGDGLKETFDYVHKKSFSYISEELCQFLCPSDRKWIYSRGEQGRKVA
jgi:hypothetical protein